MTIRHPDTENSAPMESLPVPLVPGMILVPSTPSQDRPDPIEPWSLVTQTFTQPSPTPDIGSIYTNAIAKVPYKIELKEAMTSKGISHTPPVFGDEDQQRHTRDTHNLLTIIAQLTADQKSMTDSTLKSLIAVDRCLTGDVAKVIQQQAAHTRAIKAIEDSLGGLDKRLTEEVKDSRRRFYSIAESLLEIKEMIAQGPRPTGPPPPTRPPQFRTAVGPLDDPAEGAQQPFVEGGDGTGFPSGIETMEDIVDTGVAGGGSGVNHPPPLGADLSGGRVRSWDHLP